MRIFLTISAIILLSFVSGCVSPPPLHPPDPELAHFSTIALAPVSFSTQQPLINERVNIVEVLEKALTDQLQRKGYAVVQGGGNPAGARLAVDVTSIWDDRLYNSGRAPLVLGGNYPQLQLYAEVTLTETGTGKMLLHAKVHGSGRIGPEGSPAPLAEYAEPQRDLARQISRMFPSR
jgi:hypothetical protein